MHLKITQKPSKNFDKLKDRRIKYVIIHYTGMKDQKSAIKRLQSRVAKVSCHYLISRGGKVYQMVRDLDVAWHAGKSKWGKDINLNSKSIGIELVNKGFESFPKKQIVALIKILKILKKKYKIKPSYILGHEDISPGRKTDPGPKFPWKILYNHKLTKKH